MAPRLDASFSKTLHARGLALDFALADENCGLRAVCRQMYGTPNSHHALRDVVVRYMIREAARFTKSYYGGRPAFNQYLEKMAVNGEWIGHFELTVIAELFGRDVEIYNAPSGRMFKIEPSNSDKRRAAVRLLFSSGGGGVKPDHYDSIIPVGVDIAAGDLDAPSIADLRHMVASGGPFDRFDVDLTTTASPSMSPSICGSEWSNEWPGKGASVSLMAEHGKSHVVSAVVVYQNNATAIIKFNGSYRRLTPSLFQRYVSKQCSTL